MRFGPVEVLILLWMLAVMVWVVIELRKKPPPNNWEAQKQELQNLRRRLAELQTSDCQPLSTDINGKTPEQGKH